MQTAQSKPEPASAYEQASDFARLVNQPHRASIETYVNAAPDHMKAIAQFGEWIAKSQIVTCQRMEHGVVAVLGCIEKGMGILQFAATFDIMHNGKLRKKALAAQVEFEDLGGKVRWLDIGDSGSQKAEAELEFNGEKRVFKFTLDDAKAAKIVKKDSAWETWQSEMLCARVLSRGIARLCPRVYAGFADADDDESVPALILPKSEVQEPTPAPVNRVSRECASESIAKMPVVSEFGNTTSSPSVTSTGEKAEADAGLAPDPNGYRIGAELAHQLEVALKDHIPAAVDYMMSPALNWITKDQAASGEAFRYVPEPKAKDLMSSQKRIDLFIKYATQKYAQK